MLGQARMLGEKFDVPSLRTLWTRMRAVPWAAVWEISRSLWVNAGDRLNETLSPRERQDFARLVRKGRGRPWSLDSGERSRLLHLVKKGATGTSDSSWSEVGQSLVTLLPPRLLTSIWERREARSR
jgi:hypothetical protein